MAKLIVPAGVGRLLATVVFLLVTACWQTKTVHLASAAALVDGDPLPRIQCDSGHRATVYAQGLSAPDGLAFSPDGTLYVAEETAGRVSRIEANGAVTPVLTGLANPEGISFNDTGHLYVVEDVPAGRLLRRAPDGTISILATGLDAPEGVIWTATGLYVTESNAEFVSNPINLRSRVTAVALDGSSVVPHLTSTPIINGTDVAFWSYASIVMGPDGLLYVTNELAGESIQYVVLIGNVPVIFTLYTDDSIFTIDPVTGTRTLFASGLVTPEGLRFSRDGQFPLYVVEEDVGGGAGRLSRVQADGSHAPFCTGFFHVEDVAVDANGWLYISEDSTGLIIRIEEEPVAIGLQQFVASGAPVAWQMVLAAILLLVVMTAGCLRHQANLAE